MVRRMGAVLRRVYRKRLRVDGKRRWNDAVRGGMEGSKMEHWALRR